MSLLNGWFNPRWFAAAQICNSFVTAFPDGAASLSFPAPGGCGPGHRSLPTGAGENAHRKLQDDVLGAL